VQIPSALVIFFGRKCFAFYIVILHYLQAELFSAPTQKKEATPNLRMVAYLEKEVIGFSCLI